MRIVSENTHHGFCSLEQRSRWPLMISWTAAESSIVLTSPNPFQSRSATFCSTRRIILPERVFGRPWTNCENDPEEWRSDSVQVCLKCLVFIENQWGRITWIQSGQAYLAIFLDTALLSCWGKSIPWRSTPCFSTTKAYTPDNRERENCPFFGWHPTFLTITPTKCFLLTLSFDIMWISYDSRLSHVRTLILLQESTRI